MMLDLIIVVLLAMVSVIALFARAQIRLRMNRAAQSPRPAWNVVGVSGGPWRPLGSEDRAAEPDLRIFSGDTRESHRPARQRLERH
jgi:hypothetical protein